jgi:hypothetical protein
MFVRFAAGCLLLLATATLALGQSDGWKSKSRSSSILGGRSAIARGQAGDENGPAFRDPSIARPAELPAPVGHPPSASAAPAPMTTGLVTTAFNLPATDAATAAALTPAAADALLAAAAAAPQLHTVANFSGGSGTLPNEHGQIWREYDISGYTLRVQGIEKPEQAVIDWVIRETGTQVWFSEPLGILSASRTTLRVYHTPEMQAIVKEIVDRFVGGQPSAYSYGVKLLTVNSPNWRGRMHRVMKPVNVQTPGIQAWIMTKEDAALLLTDLRTRPDYREYNSANLLMHNGQTGTLAHVKPNSYVKNIHFSGDAFGSHIPEMAQVNEGYKLEISPLVSLDGSVVDSVIKCEVDQVEKMVPITIEVPTQLSPGQRVEVQVPQIVSWRVHERFRWPADQVLVLSCGVVAKPGGGKPGLLGMPNVPNPLAGAPRADAMMFLEAKGNVTGPLAATLPAGSGVSTPAFQTGAANTYQGRY